MAKGASKTATVEVTKSSRWLDQLLAMFLLLLLCTAGYGLFDFSIEKVEVTVNGRQINAKAVEADLQQYLGKPLWQLSMQELQDRISVNAWVDSVRVEVVWPATLAVELTEFQTIARWQQHALLNQYGQIFVPDNAIFDKPLPILSGPDELSRQILAQYQVLAGQLLAHELRVERIVVAASDRWTVELSNGSRLHLGKNQITNKLQRWLKVLPQLQQQYPQTALNIDLRYSHGMAVHIIPAAIAQARHTQRGRENT